jgi:ribosome production factor 2
MSKKNDIIPFENTTQIEKHCKKHDASLFFFASNSKKRPNNLVVGK